MSWPAVAWALGQKAPSSGAKFVLVVLADNAGAEHWRSFPSVAYLVDTTQQDRKTVLKNLRALEEAALIVPDGKTGKTGQVTVWRLPVVLPNTVLKKPKKGPLPRVERSPDFPSKSPKFPAKESQKRDTEPGREPGREPERGRAPRSSPSQRGSRIPENWSPSEADLGFCREHRPDLNPQAVADAFLDYWTAKTGAGATKLDWSATWRSWVRKERGAPGGSSAPTLRPVLAADDLFTGEAA